MAAMSMVMVTPLFAQPNPTVKYVDRWLPAKVQRDRASTATVDMIMLHFCSDVIENPDNPYNVDRIVDID